MYTSTFHACLREDISLTLKCETFWKYTVRILHSLSIYSISSLPPFHSHLPHSPPIHSHLPHSLPPHSHLPHSYPLTPTHSFPPPHSYPPHSLPFTPTPSFPLLYSHPPHSHPFTPLPPPHSHSFTPTCLTPTPSLHSHPLTPMPSLPQGLYRLRIIGREFGITTLYVSSQPSGPPFECGTTVSFLLSSFMSTH